MVIFNSYVKLPEGNDENHGLLGISHSLSKPIYRTLCNQTWLENHLFNGEITTDFTEGYFRQCRSRSSMMSLIRTDVTLMWRFIHLHPFIYIPLIDRMENPSFLVGA
jgi:hypothetical protein